MRCTIHSKEDRWELYLVNLIGRKHLLLHSMYTKTCNLYFSQYCRTYYVHSVCTLSPWSAASSEIQKRSASQNQRDSARGRALHMRAGLSITWCDNTHLTNKCKSSCQILQHIRRTSSHRPMRLCWRWQPSARPRLRFQFQFQFQGQPQPQL